ncbi:hypothetical protein HID58_057506 [Brassica napus]|uniref:F5/8 type C domain-containing protein n=1 Tax=Brassica napus TaxID=3708 RepID=A0ABQ8ARC3_BRANA|nr:hypothetical protein HID58_057506 [Brassica napus]
MEGSLSLVLALMLDEASSPFNSLFFVCILKERTYYKTLHGTCVTKALKKPKPRKVGIFDVGTEKGRSKIIITSSSPTSRLTYPKALASKTHVGLGWKKKRISSWWMVDLGEDHQISIVGCSLCAATTLSDDGSRAYARSWKIQEDYVWLDGYEGIDGWENMDGLENSTVTWNSRVTSVENYTAMKWPEKTFIEQVVADESDMEGVPPAWSRILNGHLHLAALDVPYPQGWVIQNNIKYVITVR